MTPIRSDCAVIDSGPATTCWITTPPDALRDEFVRIAHRIVWCTLVTVDSRGRPRSRVVHPYVSCSYWDPAQEVAVAECDAELADDAASRRRVWDLFAAADEPLGYDPAAVLGMADHSDPRFTALRMTPWRLSTLAGTTSEAWQRPAEVSVSSAP